MIIDFYTSKFTNPKHFEEINEICAEYKNPNEKSLLECGDLTINDFISYYFKTTGQGRVYGKVVEVVLKRLVESGILALPFEGTEIQYGYKKYYRCIVESTEFLYSRNLILNLILGWEYIIKKYSNSVFKIEHEDTHGKKMIGTGFYIIDTLDSRPIYMIVTNKHVVEGAKQIKVFYKDDSPVPNSIRTVIDNQRDLAFLIFDSHLEVESFFLDTDNENILSEILTIGYPSIPLTKEAYQVYHKGEINSRVENYWGHKLFLFSAKTSSGNSGSPVINYYGAVVGIVTEELFEKEEFYNRGKPPYYAAIPSNEIINSLNENIN